MAQEITLTQGKATLVDDADFELLDQFKWFYHAATGYAKRTTHIPGDSGKSNWKKGGVLLHRAIMNPLNGMVVDHINGDKLDNRRCNLRICTPRQNSQNMRLKAVNKSGYIGVHYDKARKLYQAYARVDGDRKFLGRYTTALEASKVRDQFVKKHHGEFASLNHG